METSTVFLLKTAEHLCTIYLSCPIISLLLQDFSKLDENDSFQNMLQNKHFVNNVILPKALFNNERKTTIIVVDFFIHVKPLLSGETYHHA